MKIQFTILLSTLFITGGMIMHYNYKIIEIQKKHDRIHKVYEFRKQLNDEFSNDCLKKLPTFNEMLESDKPLKKEYWIEKNTCN